jgi:hypothetical protein
MTKQPPCSRCPRRCGSIDLRGLRGQVGDRVEDQVGERERLRAGLSRSITLPSLPGHAPLSVGPETATPRHLTVLFLPALLLAVGALLATVLPHRSRVLPLIAERGLPFGGDRARSRDRPGPEGAASRRTEVRAPES